MTNLTSLAFDENPRAEGGMGATELIINALDESGINAPAQLYDEALTLAQEGRLTPAAERLRMLLVLDPTDANAAQLLGKVMAARGQWQEALAYLDTAATNGASTLVGLKDEVQSRLQRQIQETEAHRQRVSTRERTEIRNLRSEAKRLRSDNAALELEAENLTHRVKVWSGVTALVAGSASALLLAAMLFGADNPTSDTTALDNSAVVSTAPAQSNPIIQPGTEVAPSQNTTTTLAANTNVTGDSPIKSTTTVTDIKAEKTTTTGTKTTANSTVKSAASNGVLITTHTVESGDNLYNLSRKYYDSKTEWKTILEANKDTLGGDIALQIGMKLKIPKL